MPRFQLLVREPGKEPRSVPLADPMVVGRSRSVDLTVDDEEVGRKQFRIGVTSGFVVIEGLGATNPTRIESGVLKAGEKTTLPVGALIHVGKTEFMVAGADATEQRPVAAPEVVDRTMVAGPGLPGSGLPGSGLGPAPLDPTQTASGPGAAGPAADGPMNTMEFRPPSMKPHAAAPPAAPPTANPVEEPMNTMEFRPPGLAGGPRPPFGSETSPAGRPALPGSPPSAADKPAATPETGEFDRTMAKGFRPGSPGQAAPAPQPTPPKPTPPKPAAATPEPVRPQPAKPQPATPPAVAAPKAAPAKPAAPPAVNPVANPNIAERPKTVAVRPEDMAPPPSSVSAGSDDLESRLHQSTPRLFVKGEGLKRPVRLMKAINKVGRAETVDVLLPHESVSELHAEIRFDGDHWSLVDCGSTNGCVVDGEHLRGTAQTMRRNALIGIGALNLIFLCTNKETAAQDRRDEERALQLLAKNGRLDKSTANEIRQMVRSEASQSIAEIVLRDTPLAPVDWANAVATARRKVSLFARILRIFTGGR